MKNKKKLNLISLGCAKNLVDSEILLGGLEKSNISLTKNPEDAPIRPPYLAGFDQDAND